MENKAIPNKIQTLINERYRLRDSLDKMVKKQKSIESRCFEVGQEIKKLCNHKYEDGTSAWQDRYAYGFCAICLYDDL